MTKSIRLLRRRILVAGVLGIFTGLSFTHLQAQTPAVGATTRIANWKDDKKGVFMLMFDDCCPTDVTNVYPALKKKNMTGTFYVIAKNTKGKFWEEEAPKESFVVFGNHTVNHNGFPDVATAEKELTGCNELIVRLYPGKTPRLISYGAPGGVKNAISGEEINALLAKNQLIERPPFGGHGAFIQFKNAADILKAADKSIADGKPEYVIFHGVGGDWLTFDLAQFQILIDGLDSRKDQLWIADHISVYKYEKERTGTTVTATESSPAKIQLDLKCSEDPALYDFPLTFITAVPANWTRCEVTQGDKKTVVEAKAGSVLFEALPLGTVTLTPAS